MTPHQLAKAGTEHGHQRALFAYCAVAKLHGWDVADQWAESGKIAPAALGSHPVIALEWLHAIHNQGHGDAVRGARAKAEGVRKGVADIFLPWSAKNDFGRILACGLYIEMKKPSLKPVRGTSKGPMSAEQTAFGAYAKSQGYGFSVCYSWQEAVAVLRRYIESNRSIFDANDV